MIRKVRDWTCSLVFMLVFGASLLVWDVALRIAGLLGLRAQSYTGNALQVWLFWTLAICRIRVAVERSPLVRKHTSYIIVSNHQSLFDMPIFGVQFFTNFPKYIAKIELAKWIPAISFHLRHGGHAIIDRKDREGAVKAIDELGRTILDHGFSAVIFPEGTRARHGELRPFKPAGTVALLRQARHTPVVPVCIDGSWRIMEHSMLPVPFGITLDVWIGDPIERRDDEDPFAIVAEAERRIQAALQRMRGAADAPGAAGSTGAPASASQPTMADGAGLEACEPAPSRAAEERDGRTPLAS